MNKLLAVVLLLVCVSAFADEEITDERSITFSIYGEAIFAPLVYRGDMHGEIIAERESGFGLGVGGGGWGGVGAGLAFGVFGTAPGGHLGFELEIRPSMSGGNFHISNNRANVWAQPNDWFRMVFGRYQWEEFQGRIDGIEGVVSGYGGGKNSIFQSVDSNIFGALFILTPPAFFPDALQGLTFFSSFGVSGWLNRNDNRTFAARANLFAEYIFSTPHLGLAYENHLGLARVQFIGSNYMWGRGIDWAAETGAGHVDPGGIMQLHAWFPARVREYSQLEMAVNLTFIPGFNLDIGLSLAFPVTVIAGDGGRGAMPIGPTYGRLGHRQRLAVIDNRRLAEELGDVWQPPSRVAAGALFDPANLPFSFHLQTMMEFGEQIAFSDGSPNFVRGLLFEAGLSTTYSFNDANSVTLNTAARIRQNDTFYGRLSPAFQALNEMAIASLNHNGRVDLGLAAFFTRDFRGGSVRTGVCATLPVGGDRYFWSSTDVIGHGGYRLHREHTDAYRLGNLVVMIPIIITLNF